MMPLDYIVSSLPALSFGEPAPVSWETFSEYVGGRYDEKAFDDLETQLRNALAEARGGSDKYRRSADGCSLYWKNRILACFQEKDVFKRDEMIDRTWWDAAGELTDPLSPLGAGALATYAVRLKLAIKRSKISKEAGLEVFDRLAGESSGTGAGASDEIQTQATEKAKQ